MALSSWDCLSFNSECQSCNGVFKHFKYENYVYIYKNWIYVSSKDMWRENYEFSKHTIAAINSGNMQLAGFNIFASRGPQNSVFVYVYCMEPNNKKSIYHRFAGIGCYGFKDVVEENLKKIGRVVKEGETWYYEVDYTGKYSIGCYETKEKIVYWDEEKQGKYNYDNDWTGVIPSTVESFFKWLLEISGDFDVDFKNWIEKCKQTKYLRFNQGDEFLASNLNLELNCTTPGDSQPPIIFDILE